MDAHAYPTDDGLLLEELGWIRRVADRLLADPNDADDIVQEAWLKTRELRERFDSRGRLRAWLSGMARRMALDRLRARRRLAAREERAALLAARAEAEDGVERIAALEALLQAVRALDEPQRKTILMRYLDEYSTAEIAAAMDVSEEVVRKRLTRARTQLRATLCARLGLPAERPLARALRRASIAGAIVVTLLGLRALWGAREATDTRPAPASPALADAARPEGTSTSERNTADTRAQPEPDGRAGEADPLGTPSVAPPTAAAPRSDSHPYPAIPASVGQD